MTINGIDPRIMPLMFGEGIVGLFSDVVASRRPVWLGRVLDIGLTYESILSTHQQTGETLKWQILYDVSNSDATRPRGQVSF